MSHPIGRGRGAILPAWMSNANVDVPSLGSFGGRPSDNDNTFKYATFSHCQYLGVKTTGIH